MAKFKRFLAMALVLFVFASALPMQALAAEPVHTTEPSPEGLVTNVYTTTETNTDENGNTVITVTIEKNTEGVIEEDGKEVTLDRDESVIHTQTEKANGSTSEHVVEEGTETKSWVEEDTGDEPGQPDVVVPLIPGQPTQGIGGVVESEPVTNPDGSVTTTTTTDRTVNAETSDSKTTINDSDSGLVEEQESGLKAPAPVYDPEDGPAKDAAGKEGLFDRNFLSSHTYDYVCVNGVSIWIDKGAKTIIDVVIPEGAALPDHDLLNKVAVGANVASWYPKSNSFDKKLFPEGTQYKSGVKVNNSDNWYDADGNLIVTIPDEGEYRYVGTGEHSKYYAGMVDVIYKRDKDTNELILDENGKPIIEKMLSLNGTEITVNGELCTDPSLVDFFNTYSGSRAQNFMLTDKNGNKVFAYCCDVETGTVKGTWYSVSNLEDSDYYASEESEEHIRSIVLNGYWGTTDTPDEDGAYALGSLEGIKAKLKAAIEAGEISGVYETYRYSECDCGGLCSTDAKKGPPCVGGKLQYDENGKPIVDTYDMLALLDELTAGEALLATQAAIWSFANGHSDALNGVDGTIIVDAGTRSNFKGTSNEHEPLSNEGNARAEFLYNWLVNLDTKESSTVIINDKNFVEDMSLIVHDKAEHENNQDEDQDNDVYNTDLNFKLAFIPGEKDDLLVQISYTDLNGEPVTVIRRLAGTNAEGQTYEGIKPEADGSYILKDLKLSENEDFNFDLRLEGTQYLENGVYVYSPVGGRDVSQTFVGVAEGKRNVDVSVGVTIKFDVDENNHVVAERKWHDEYDPEEDPEDPPIPVIFRLDVDTTEEIPEEPVPLAAPVTTGDNSFPWMLIVMMAVFGMAVVNVIGKKKAA